MSPFPKILTALVKITVTFSKVTSQSPGGFPASAEVYIHLIFHPLPILKSGPTCHLCVHTPPVAPISRKSETVGNDFNFSESEDCSVWLLLCSAL